MTMLLSGFGLLGRFAGDLLTSALSWASSLLFGRVPRSHQTFLRRRPLRSWVPRR